MSELLAEFAAWQHWQEMSPRTINSRTQIVQRLAAFVAPLPIFEVEADDIVRFLRPELTARTKNVYLSNLSAFYAWAISRGYTDFDPTATIQRPKAPRNVPRPIDHDDLVRAIDCAGPRMRAWLLLGALAGLRCIEIVRLAPAAIAGDSLRLTGKGGHTRHVPVHPLLEDALNMAPPPYNVGESALSVKIAAYFEGLGIDATAHCCRHYFATHVYRTSGFDLLLTSELLGHASVATTQIYTQVDRNSARAAVLALALSDTPPRSNGPR